MHKRFRDQIRADLDSLEQKFKGKHSPNIIWTKYFEILRNINENATCKKFILLFAKRETTEVLTEGIRQ